MKTIKELADELGVSKTAVRKYMDEEFRRKHTEINSDGLITIDSDGCKLIAESVRKPRKTAENQFAETTGNQSSQDEVAFLREQLRAKDRQIEAQLEQISQLTAALEHTTASLHAAQALHAGTMQQQLEAGDLKAEVAADQAEPPRKWWQFWR